MRSNSFTPPRTAAAIAADVAAAAEEIASSLPNIEKQVASLERDDYTRVRIESEIREMQRQENVDLTNNSAVLGRPPSATLVARSEERGAEVQRLIGEHQRITQGMLNAWKHLSALLKRYGVTLPSEPFPRMLNLREFIRVAGCPLPNPPSDAKYMLRGAA